MARGLKHGRTRLIGLIIADITNPYSVNVMAAALKQPAGKRGFTLLVCNTNNELDQELRYYLDLLRSYEWKASWSTQSVCGRMA